LMPVIDIIFSEYFPIMETTVKEISKIVEKEQLKSDDALPRTTERFCMPMMDGQYKRASFTYSVWRMQRLQNIVNNFTDLDKKALNTWLAEQGQQDFSTIDYGHKLKRKGLVAALA
jgi:hypothetical protein